MQNFYERYKSHILLEEIGVSGQQRIKTSRVLIVGAGGLGSPLALYLAAAGVGNIGIIDFDKVELSNLQRQILFSGCDAGKNKALIAKEKIKNLNPEIKVDAYDEKLTAENALELFKNYDIVADASDNFQTRYLVNDACVITAIPDVWASVYKFEGQVSVFNANVFNAQKGPCYRCFHPQAPKPGSVPSCGEGGVLGALTGVIGSMQACEVLKLITGAGDSLAGRLLYFDALTMSSKEFKIKKDETCVLCGKNPSAKRLPDYGEFCRLDAFGENEITFAELETKIKNGKKIKLIIIDENDSIINSANTGKTPPVDSCAFIRNKFPKTELLGAALNNIVFLKNKLDAGKETVFVCEYGYKSVYAVRLLKESGYLGKMYSLKGGTSNRIF